MRYSKGKALIAALLFCSSFIPASAQVESEDPYQLKFVQANLRIARSGVDIPTIVKNFQKLGAGVSIALLKILDERELTNPKTVNSYLPLIRQSFSAPSNISIEANRNPNVTLFLLVYLQHTISDTETRRAIQDTVQFVKQKTGTQTSPSR